MNTFRRAAAEFIGTCVLVVVGCGTAMTVGCSGTGYLLTALAFGLGLLTMAYSIGNISGCHINPALSFAMLILGKMSYKTSLPTSLPRIWEPWPVRESFP